MYIRDGMVLEGLENQPDEEDDFNVLPPDLEEKDEMMIMEPPEIEEIEQIPDEMVEETMELSGTIALDELQTVPPVPETIVNESNFESTVPMSDVTEARKRPCPATEESLEQNNGGASKKKKRKLRIKEDSMEMQDEEAELDLDDL